MPPTKKVKSTLSIKVLDIKGVETKEKAVPKEIFSIAFNDQLLAQYVRVYQANKRQGNASSKTRGEVTGSTRKIYKQKGTGRARHGSNKAPIFVGGGVVGGPSPRDFSLRMNKKQKTLALFGALSMKLKDKEIIGFSNQFLKMEAKTKKIVDMLKKSKLYAKKLLVILPKMEKNNFVLSGRNISGLLFSDAMSINAFEVLKADVVVFIEDAVDMLTKHFVKKT